MRRVFALGCRRFLLRPLPGGELLILYRVRLLWIARARTITEEPVHYTRAPFER